MTYRELVEQIRKKKSYLCVGLDTDINQVPRFILEKEYAVFEFNKKIVDATAPYAVAFKPNLAFYETLGAAGWINLEMTVDYIRKNHPDVFLIADAKRGDIGNTSKMYALTFLKNMGFDAVTVAPYMGEDSVAPFLSVEERFVILLAVTSNKGADDFQLLPVGDGKQQLWEQVITTSRNWGTAENMMYVAGATRPEIFRQIRKLVPDHFLLVPGIGAQGGDLKAVSDAGFNKHCGLLVNSSRAIIYADCTNNFDAVAGQKAREVQQEMQALLAAHRII
jgi:orotidine-5'-phosphate decarboxylase